MDKSDVIKDIIQATGSIENALCRTERCLIEAIGENQEVLDWFRLYQERQQRLDEQRSKLSAIQSEQNEKLIKMVSHVQELANKAYMAIDLLQEEARNQLEDMCEVQDLLRMQTIKLDYLTNRN